MTVPLGNIERAAPIREERLCRFFIWQLRFGKNTGSMRAFRSSLKIDVERLTEDRIGALPFIFRPHSSGRLEYSGCH